jgi:threonine synthase
MKHLLKNGKEIPREKLTQVFAEANDLLESLEHLMSEDEYTFVKESINSKAIPAPKLLIKDYKEINDDGNYPTRLVVPATNFTSAFPKLGYIGIKKIMDEVSINCSRKNNVQASHLKTQIESLGIRKDKHTLFSLAIEAFYP